MNLNRRGGQRLVLWYSPSSSGKEENKRNVDVATSLQSSGNIPQKKKGDASRRWLWGTRDRPTWRPRIWRAAQVGFRMFRPARMTSSTRSNCDAMTGLQELQQNGVKAEVSARSTGSIEVGLTRSLWSAAWRSSCRRCPPAGDPSAPRCDDSGPQYYLCRAPPERDGWWSVNLSLSSKTLKFRWNPLGIRAS